MSMMSFENIPLFDDTEEDDADMAVITVEELDHFGGWDTTPDVTDDGSPDLLESGSASGGTASDETTIRYDPYPTEWYSQISCGTASHHLFFGTAVSEAGKAEYDDGHTSVAKRICDECPVSDHCFRMAVTTLPDFGIWAGMKPQSIRRFRYRRMNGAQRKQLDDGGMTLIDLHRLRRHRVPKRRTKKGKEK